MKKGNCIVGQSGGPTAAINASLVGVVKEVLASDNYDKVFGMINGIAGFLEGRYMNLSDKFNDENSLSQLAHTPAMYLGSCRFRLPDISQNAQMYEEIFTMLEKENITTIFYIGGNDSMDTVLKLSSYAKLHNKDVNVIGIPKTIDNDLPITDHTPGYGSAAKYIATTLLEIAHDTYIYNIPSVAIVEIMGRDAGWLTASSALARTSYSHAPDLIYLPEVPFDLDNFVQDIKTAQRKRKNIIIAVSKGIKDKDGNYISASSTTDAFGHKQLCGVGKMLEHHLKETLRCKVRSIEINVSQRAGGHIASKTDIDEAIAIGQEAVRVGATGETAKMMCYQRTTDQNYHCNIVPYDIKDIANLTKTIPLEWISKAHNDVTQQLIDYMLPLIEGEVNLSYKNGVPKYCDISHLY
ncbi:MAG: 6-phosphofructokinase [Epulopiscium sp. Nele67-Bin005]|nr:MAG: 6-phosphofructokinase [Epulopiscium sp. Nele67-Bin005]